ncbi:MAG: hypothetical protein ACP5NO_08275 [Thermoplasmata archaeon]
MSELSNIKVNVIPKNTLKCDSYDNPMNSVRNEGRNSYSALIRLIVISLLLLSILTIIVHYFYGRLLSYSIALVSTSLSVDAIAFSAYLSLRTNLLYSSRQADMQAISFLKRCDATSTDFDRYMAKRWIIFSEEYRRNSNVRGHSALLLAYAGILFVVSLVLIILSRKTYWLIPYYLGLLFFSSSMIVHRRGIGYLPQKSIIDYISPGNLLRFFGLGKSPDVLVLPPRFSFIYNAGEGFCAWWREFLYIIEHSNELSIIEDTQVEKFSSL